MQPVIKLLILSFLFPAAAWSQVKPVPYLEKKITINVKNTSLSDVFTIIEKQSGVIFSYNPKQVNDQKKITIQFYKTALRLVLENLLHNTNYHYKIRNNYIILTATGKSIETVSPVILSGYVYNRQDGSVIENASVYVPSGKTAAVSDQYGYFSIPRTKNQTLQLAVAKENFKDTLFLLPEHSNESVKLFLSPKNTVPVKKPDSSFTVNTDTAAPVQADTTPAVPEKRLSFWPNINKIKVNLKNIKDTFFTDFSFSFVPPLSTNKLLAYNTVNKFSFNVLAGYSKGVKYAELGGLVNVDNGDVGYAQIGGIGNSVSGSVQGFQAGGIYSINQKNTTGMQVGGIVCKTRSKITGMQAGGIMAQANQVDGFQAGGIFSLSQTRVKGGQVGGLFTLADTLYGVQIAGLFNRANRVYGAQIAGLMNRTNELHGFQLGILNFAKDAKGIPFGVFSYVKNGYHKIECSVNELQMANLGFRTGVNHLHNIFFAGIGLNGANRSWTYGYGLGATFQIGKKWGISTDLTTQQVNPVGGSQQYINLVNKFLVAAEFTVSNKFSIAAGPSYNIRVTDTRSSSYDTVISPNLVTYIYDRNETGSTINTKMWIGGTVSVKFL